MNFSRIVIGSSVEALLYAFKTDSHILMLNHEIPFEFDYSEENQTFDFLKISDTDQLSTNGDTIRVGAQKQKIWQKLLFVLHLSGKVLFGNQSRSATIDSNSLSVGCEGAKRRDLFFDKLTVFDDHNVYGLPPAINQIKKKNVVYDWFNVNSCEQHEYDFLQFDTDFVKNVFFYKTKRSKSQIKDFVTVSYLEDEEIYDFSNSETYVKFKMLSVYEELGIRGTRNGRDPKRAGHYKHYALDIESANRVVTPRVQNIYPKISNIDFNYMSFDDIYMLEDNSSGYTKKIAEML